MSLPIVNGPVHQVKERVLYGVNKATLDAYVQVERLKIWEAVLTRMCDLECTLQDDWVNLRDWIREQAAKETQP